MLLKKLIKEPLLQLSLSGVSFEVKKPDISTSIYMEIFSLLFERINLLRHNQGLHGRASITERDKSRYVDITEADDLPVRI